ncbi:hypothetical protein FTUN_4976 [Frigoriglobus tundricola]|uniref:Uncharacterized protein n=1 Tax=Frigoriglobus tundricola TaxID=2774151 RepID=A0A6M5YWU1_9BACT|nr:hypothetical protein FTUN_4976 [Frigoriglobus tundricola]
MAKPPHPVFRLADLAPPSRGEVNALRGSQAMCGECPPRFRSPNTSHRSCGARSASLKTG